MSLRQWSDVASKTIEIHPDASKKTAAMWCSQCQQDVPGIASHDNQLSIVCARCGDDLNTDSKIDSADQASDNKTDDSIQDDMALPMEPAVSGASWRIDPMPIDLTSWPIDEQLQEAERLIRSVSGNAAREVPSVDPPQAAIPSWHVASPPPTSQNDLLPQTVTSRIEHRGSKIAAWVCLSLGLMGTVCGGVLLGWSIFGARPDLWSLGLPIVLTGQAGLFLGFVLQLEGLWRSSRHTTDTLDILDQRLSELHHATSHLSTTHSSGAQGFYSHITVK